MFTVALKLNASSWYSESYVRNRIPKATICPSQNGVTPFDSFSPPENAPTDTASLKGIE